MGYCHMFILQIVCVAGIFFGSQNLDLGNKHKWALIIARYFIYLLTIQASVATSVLIHQAIKIKQGLDARFFSSVNQSHLTMYAGAVAVLYVNKQSLYADDFVFLFIAYLLVKYPIVGMVKTPVSYGAGMAFSYVEGYLAYVLPPEGAEMRGFVDRIRQFEDIHNVAVPVKRMFVIVTRSMYCPPDLKEFNHNSDSKNVNRLEACSSIEEVIKDVAGVKRRVYKSAAYKIVRDNMAAVHVAAECATPLHTLHKAIKNNHIYRELVDLNVEEIVSDFTTTLRMVLDKTQLSDKCEVVYFDDTDPSLNLADVLLDRIRELEPDFERLICRDS